MLGFYSIRKLIEVQKLSNDVAGQRLALDAFPWLGTPVNRHNRLYFNKLYDLKAGSSKNCDLLFVCHQLVHSYIFALCGDENMRLEGIYVTSERERHKFLYFASIQTIVDLFEQVGSNYPNQIHSRYDPQKQDYVLFSQVVSNEE